MPTLPRSSSLPLRPAGPWRILIVEDESLVAMDLDARLRKLGYHVVGIADDAAHAVELVRTGRPDLVLMDISLRDGPDGVETARAISRIREIPVVFLTAYADDRTLERAATVSPYGYVLKPFDERTMAASVRIALERAQADAQLRVLTSATERASIGMVLVAAGDADRPVVFANGAYTASRGVELPALLGAPLVLPFVSPELPEVQRLDQALEVGLATAAAVELRGADGARSWAHVTTAPVRDASGALTHVLVCQQDITRQHAAESALMLTQRLELMGRLGKGVAGDLRDILGVVLSYAEGEVARRGALGAPSADVHEVAAAARRGLRLATRLQEFSDAPARSAGATDLGGVVTDAGPLLSQMVGPRVRLHLEPGPGTWLVAVPPATVEQILLNLLAEVRAGMPEGGQVVVRVVGAEARPGADGRFVRTEILGKADGGGASAPEDLPRLRFGMATSAVLAEAVGGSITLEPGADGAVRMVVRLPAADIEEDARRGVSPAALATAGSASCLLVEDEPALRRVFASALRGAGFVVTDVPTAEHALEALERASSPFSLVITDLALPGQLGTVVLQQASSLSPQTQLLLITGHHQVQLVPETVPVLWKPFLAGALVRRAVDLVEAQAPSAPAAPAEARPAPAEHAADPSVPTVLLVEDAELIRMVVRGLLEQRGLRVLEAATLAEGMEQAGRGPLDLLLLDLQLPDGDGLELLDRLRASDPLLPCVVLSADRRFATARRAVDKRVMAYVSKPVDRHALLRRVEEALAAGQTAKIERKLLVAKAGRSVDYVGAASTRRDFEEALDRLYVVFQPIVRPRGPTLYAYEALMRSRSAALPGPAELLAAAEALGRLPELSRRVRERVARALLDRSDVEVPIFVNLHPTDLHVDLCRDDEPLRPFASRIVLEVTERAQLDEGADVSATVAALRAAGYRLALDDLGEGYAGLSWLVRLRPDIAKLDMSLIRGVDTSRLKRELVASLVGVCRRSQTTLVAEGVETAGEADVLVGLGCDLLQGYHFGRPAPPFPTIADAARAAASQLPHG